MIKGNTFKTKERENKKSRDTDREKIKQTKKTSGQAIANRKKYL